MRKRLKRERLQAAAGSLKSFLFCSRFRTKLSHYSFSSLKRKHNTSAHRPRPPSLLTPPILLEQVSFLGMKFALAPVISKKIPRRLSQEYEIEARLTVVKILHEFKVNFLRGILSSSSCAWCNSCRINMVDKLHLTECQDYRNSDIVALVACFDSIINRFVGSTPIFGRSVLLCSVPRKFSPCCSI